jgi:Pilus formation protein N terminal region
LHFIEHFGVKFQNWFQRGSRNMQSPFRACERAASLIAALAINLAASSIPALTAEFNVVLDQALMVRATEGVATIVVGNPLMANATLKPGGLMVITGRGYGNTNLIELDRNGTVLTEHSITIHGPTAEAIIVYQGSDRASLRCAPICKHWNLPSVSEAGSGAKAGSGGGQCNTPGDTAKDGSSCGGRAASARPGGKP